jgi:hypothetical protein
MMTLPRNFSRFAILLSFLTGGVVGAAVTTIASALVLKHVELQHASAQGANAIHALRALQSIRADSHDHAVGYLRSSIAFNVNALREWSDTYSSDADTIEEEVIAKVLREIATYDHSATLFSRDRQPPEFFEFLVAHRSDPTADE